MAEAVAAGGSMVALLEKLDLEKLPADVRNKLSTLQLELSEGDITQKGFEKKTRALLSKHLDVVRALVSETSTAASPSTRQARRAHRRHTKEENRYHSEIRTEAVQQALAANQAKAEKAAALQPIRRTSSKRPGQPSKASGSVDVKSDSSTDDESTTTGGGDTPTPGRMGSRPVADVTASHQNGGKTQQPRSSSTAATTRQQPPDVTNTSVTCNIQDQSKVRTSCAQIRLEANESADKRMTVGSEDKADAPLPPTPKFNIDDDEDKDVVVYANTPPQGTTSVPQTTTTPTRTQVGISVIQVGDYANALIKPPKVSVKIQQLLHTLQRPRKKPLAEYYNDDDAELEALATTPDPRAPRPEGALINPARGESVQVADDRPRSLDAALLKFGTSPATSKLPVATVLDQQGRPAISLTYGKLLNRASKLAHLLLHRLTHPVANAQTGKMQQVPQLSVGDRVALVYPNNDPLNFCVAFYGCLFAGIVPVPIDVPVSKNDAGIQQLGFLLGSLSVRVALTSDVCLKGLPKAHSTGAVEHFKGWPRLNWVVTEHLPKPPKDWKAPPRLTDDTTAYVEYACNNEGSVKGVCVTRTSMMAHCRALSAACAYRENEVAVCVLDFKRETGLWHAVLASVLNGMQVIYIPYALMKINPSSWMLMVSKFKAAVALVKSRDLHWGMLATKHVQDINLASLRVLLVADGANPWSLSSCDQFVQTFQSVGLRPDALCPCAASSETLTVCIRRAGRSGVGNSGRGVLSMSALSHGVVRVDNENSLTSLTLQDAGQVLPGAVVIVVRLNGPPRLCKADEIGEICVYGHSTASSYFGLDGLSNHTFKVEPLGADDRPLGAVQYVRSGLVGFLGPGGLVFVCGSRTGLMRVSGRYHNADDIIATVLAVEPMKFVYRGRIAVFSVKVLCDERICIVAEQKNNVPEEDSFRWMSRVLQAIDSIHQVGVYCLALVSPNHLPKSPLGGIHVSDTRQRFVDGQLHATNLLMCPHTCVTNLPKPREPQPDVGPAAMMVGNIVQGIRIANARGRDLAFSDEDRNVYLTDILRHRAQQSPDHVLFTLINAKGMEESRFTCAALYRKAERISCLLVDKAHLNPGDHVALIFAPGCDIICAFYACLLVGLVPVCIRPPHAANLQTTLPTVRMIVDVSRAVAILSTNNMIRLLRSKEASHKVDVKAWPTIIDMDEMPKRKTMAEPVRPASPTSTCYLDFSVSTTGMLAGVVQSYAGVSALCKSLKLAGELYPSRHVCLCLDPYCGLGFALWCLSSVYSGHHSVLIPPSEVEQNPSLWLSTVSSEKVRDTYCSYGVMELCVRELGASTILSEKSCNLSSVRTCVVVAEERPRLSLTTAFCKLFAPLGLSSRAVSTSFGCRVNVAMCLQGASSPDPCTVYVDVRALRNDRVTLLEKGAPHSLALMESGKLLPGAKVVIANSETKGQCADSHLGEIWVSSEHNAAGYFTVYGDESSLHTEHFSARLSTGDTQTMYARTGYLGFLRQTQSVTADGELHDAVFVVGAVEETLMLRGMRYHPCDLESTVIRAHKNICECACFTWTNLLVVVAELDGPEGEALDLVPAITSRLLEEHQLICGVVVVVDPGVVPINSRGEKQRMHLRDSFLHDQLDPIYVAYNM